MVFVGQVRPEKDSVPSVLFLITLIKCDGLRQTDDLALDA